MAHRSRTRPITGAQIVALAARAKRSTRSVERVYDGTRVNDHTRAGVCQAALDLGLPLPVGQEAASNDD